MWLQFDTLFSYRFSRNLWVALFCLHAALQLLAYPFLSKSELMAGTYGDETLSHAQTAAIVTGLHLLLPLIVSGMIFLYSRFYHVGAVFPNKSYWLDAIRKNETSARVKKFTARAASVWMAHYIILSYGITFMSSDDKLGKPGLMYNLLASAGIAIASIVFVITAIVSIRQLSRFITANKLIKD